MTSTEKRVAEREALRSVIQQWNANRLDLFELSEPDEASYDFYHIHHPKISFYWFYKFIESHEIINTHTHKLKDP